MNFPNPHVRPALTRRDLLCKAGGGFGALALSYLLQRDNIALGHAPVQSQIKAPLPHHRPTAKSVIFLFMEGGPSHIDLFDPKQALRDLHGKPVQEYWQDMKFWWPQNETIIATLLAYLVTGKEKYARWHQQIHDYAYAHFWDKDRGEWYGYLHRDGTVAQTAKGNLFKGPFHLPRQEWYCAKILNETIEQHAGEGRLHATSATP